MTPPPPPRPPRVAGPSDLVAAHELLARRRGPGAAVRRQQPPHAAVPDLRAALRLRLGNRSPCCSASTSCALIPTLLLARAASPTASVAARCSSRASPSPWSARSRSPRAQSLAWLFAGEIIYGIGGGLVMACVSVAIRELHPEQHVTARRARRVRRRGRGADARSARQRVPRVGHAVADGVAVPARHRAGDDAGRRPRAHPRDPAGPPHRCAAHADHPRPARDPRGVPSPSPSPVPPASW